MYTRAAARAAGLCRAVVAVALALVATVATAAERHATVPLKSLAALSAWQPADAPWNRATEALRHRPGADHPLADLWVPRAASQNPTTGVVAMHDMGSGYKADQDRFPGGTRNARLYRFTHWQYVDAFVYFAHDRVSFPPPGWTDSAHRNGVLSLGTFDIEGKLAEVEDELRLLLDDPARRRRYAEKLAAVARGYGFDGYLVNIETTLATTPAKRVRRARSLAAFVGELRAALRKDNPGARVIWYDSIIRTGALAYQNELNAKNLPFFRRADGITVNYDWSPPLHDGSPRTSARVAGARKLAVYSAVDAFCRDSARLYCGWNSYLGARAAGRAGTSFGVFAPAWAYEGDGADPDRANFPQRDRRFWVGTADERRPAGGVAEFVAARPVPSTLPFRTHFDQGMGQARYHDGKVATPGRWGDVGAVDVLPTWLDTALSGSGRYAAELTTKEAFQGGSSFRISTAGAPRGHTLRPLFRTAFDGVRAVDYTVRHDGLDAAIVVVAANPSAPTSPIVLVLAPPGRSAPPAGVDYGVRDAAGRKAPVTVLRPRASRAFGGDWSRRTYSLKRILAGRTIAGIGILAYPRAGAETTGAASPAGAEAGADVLLGGLAVR